MWEKLWIGCFNLGFMHNFSSLPSIPSHVSCAMDSEGETDVAVFYNTPIVYDYSSTKFYICDTNAIVDFVPNKRKYPHRKPPRSDLHFTGPPGRDFGWEVHLWRDSGGKENIADTSTVSLMLAVTLNFEKQVLIFPKESRGGFCFFFNQFCFFFSHIKLLFV